MILVALVSVTALEMLQTRFSVVRPWRQPPPYIAVATSAAVELVVAIMIWYPSDLVSTAVAVLVTVSVAQALPMEPESVTLEPTPQTVPSVLVVKATMMKRLFSLD